MTLKILLIFFLITSFGFRSLHDWLLLVSRSVWLGDYFIVLTTNIARCTFDSLSCHGSTSWKITSVPLQYDLYIFWFTWTCEAGI